MDWMTPSSISRRSRYGALNAGRSFSGISLHRINVSRARPPVHAALQPQGTPPQFCPSGTGNAGNTLSPSRRSRLQRRAISTVLASASGASANSPPFPQACAGIAAGCSVRGLSVSARTRESWIHTRASCALKSSATQEAHVVGRDDRRTRLARKLEAGAHTIFFASATGTDQLEVEAIRKDVSASLRAARAPVHRDWHAAHARYRCAGHRTTRSGQRSSPRSATHAAPSAHHGPALDITASHQLGQFAIAVIVLHEQQQACTDGPVHPRSGCAGRAR